MARVSRQVGDAARLGGRRPAAGGGARTRLLRSLGLVAVVEDVDALCDRALGAPAEELLFTETSVGEVFGLRLTDGRRVVVKVHRAWESPETLTALVRVQAHHFRAGFPCPEPLAGPLAVGDRHATIETYVDDGEPGDTRVTARRASIAQALARHLELARACGTPPALARGWSAYPAGRLWPTEAHDPRIDLAGTAAGAEWIDALATRARPVATLAAARVLGHHDWSAKHFRFAGDRITVVYDWDSVRLGSEAVVVGNAACSFTANFDLPGVDPAPTPDETRAFVDDYDEARAAPLSRAERTRIAACGLYLMAYTARCEHAKGDRDGPFTRALQRHRDAYLLP